MNETIHIYHTNDLHSHFEHWPQIHAFLHERKRWHEAEGDICLVLDIGDHVDRSHPFTEATAGRGNVQLLNDTEYDAITIGNNEGITLSKEELENLYVQADFDIIVGNLFHKDGTRPQWAKPYHFIKTESGIQIALVGATAEFTPFYERLGWTVTDGKEAIQQAVREVERDADLIICLSHLGIKEDELLAELCPEIDVILGAHTHHTFHEGKRIGKTTLGAAGKFGFYIGHVMIEEMGTKVKAQLIETAELPEPDAVFNRKLVELGKKELSRPVFQNDHYMKAEWFDESRLADEFGTAMLNFSGADCAMFNAGIFMGDVPDGTVTRFDFHRVLPHPINPCLVELTGAELKEIYMQSLNDEWPNIELKGLGFRGRVMGKMIHKNIELKDHRLYVGGKAVKPHAVYQLITLDMFTFGYFFPTLKRAKKTYIMPEFLRDVMAGHFSEFAEERK